VGEFRNDEKTHGTFRWRGGDTYTGEWKNSLMHGRGTYTYKNRRTYEGDWVAGYKQGYGIFTWPIGDRYEGEFVKDQCHGMWRSLSLALLLAERVLRCCTPRH